MCDFFVLPIISQWDSYEDGAPPRFAYPVQVWLDNHCCGWWTGHWDQIEWVYQGQRLGLSVQTKNTWWMGTTDSRYVCHHSSWLI